MCWCYFIDTITTLSQMFWYVILLFNWHNHHIVTHVLICADAISLTQSPHCHKCSDMWYSYFIETITTLSHMFWYVLILFHWHNHHIIKHVLICADHISLTQSPHYQTCSDMCWSYFIDTITTCSHMSWYVLILFHWHNHHIVIHVLIYANPILLTQSPHCHTCSDMC